MICSLTYIGRGEPRVTKPSSHSKQKRKKRECARARERALKQQSVYAACIFIIGDKLFTETHVLSNKREYVRAHTQSKCGADIVVIVGLFVRTRWAYGWMS